MISSEYAIRLAGVAVVFLVAFSICYYAARPVRTHTFYYYYGENRKGPIEARLTAFRWARLKLKKSKMRLEVWQGQIYSDIWYVMTCKAIDRQDYLAHQHNPTGVRELHVRIVSNLKYEEEHLYENFVRRHKLKLPVADIDSPCVPKKSEVE